MQPLPVAAFAWFAPLKCWLGFAVTFEHCRVLELVIDPSSAAGRLGITARWARVVADVVVVGTDRVFRPAPWMPGTEAYVQNALDL
jgi:hypothetical protein